MGPNFEKIWTSSKSLLIDNPLIPPPTIFFHTWNYELWKKNLMHQILTKSKKFQILGPWSRPPGELLKLVHNSYCYKLAGSFKGWILNITPLKACSTCQGHHRRFLAGKTTTVVAVLPACPFYCHCVLFHKIQARPWSCRSYFSLDEFR
jgi:hypothetical protein